MKFYEMVEHNPGPLDYIVSDLDPRSRSLDVKRSKPFFCE